MNYLDAINARTSKRDYTGEPMLTPHLEKMEEVIKKANSESGLHIKLIRDEDSIFSKFSKSYGLFKNPPYYLAMIAPKNMDDAKKAIGYYGEKLVLEATLLGLGTCWVAGTYDKETCQNFLTDSEDLFCVITLGYVSEKKTLKSVLFSRAPEKGKGPESLYEATGDIPQWFLDGMDAVWKAPSAVNRKPVTFLYRDGIVTTRVEPNHTVEDIDLGIALLHFEIGSGHKLY